MSNLETPASETPDVVRENPTEARVRAALAGIEGLELLLGAPNDAMLTLELDRAALHTVMQHLRDDAGFETVTFVTCVDRLGETTQEPRFEVLHQLLSIQHGDRVRTRVRLDSADACLDSITDLWPGAGYMEREAFDMFGVRFDGHPNLKRLLMPEGYGHHPLRKDFPHQGIEPDRLYREWDRERRKAWKPEGTAHGTPTGTKES